MRAAALFRARTSGYVAVSQSDPFIANFASIEARWVNGEDTAGEGVLQNLTVASNRLQGGNASPNPQFDDAVGHVSGLSMTAHYGECTVYRAGGYTPANVHEMEFLAGFTIKANFNCGYEILANTNGDWQIIRQNGTIGDHTTISYTAQNGGPTALANGDVVRWEYEETGDVPTIRVYIDSVLVMTATDESAERIHSGKTISGNTMLSQPGNGFFSRGDGYVVGNFAIENGAEYGSL